MADTGTIDSVSKLPGQRRTQDERSEKMRARLLDAAIKVLVKRGYSGFRIAEVATTAGVSRGALIHHYSTKETLIAACLAHVFTNALENTRRRTAEVVEADDILARASEDAQEFFFSDNFLVGFDIVRSGGKNVDFLETIRSISSSTRQPTEKLWVNSLAESGLPRDQAETILWILWSVIRGLMVRREIGRDPAREKKVLAVTLRLLRNFAAEIRSS